MFKLNLSTLDAVQGVNAYKIPYEIRVTDANWSKYFGKYQNQKWAFYDTSSCWILGGAINQIEDQLEYLTLVGAFGTEALDFFKKHGYIDSDGDYSLSERFIEILGGERDNGGSAPLAWKLVTRYGCIPRSMLTYTNAKAASFSSLEGFVNDYFNPAEVTPEMKALGLQFKQYVNIAYQQIGQYYKTPEMQILKAALRQAPLSIGVPIPQNVAYWNNDFVQYDGSPTPQHEIELYGINDKGEYLIFDQYEPHLKTLSADYYIPLVNQGVVTAKIQAAPNPIKQNSLWVQVWTAINEYFNRFNTGRLATSQ